MKIVSLTAIFSRCDITKIWATGIKYLDVVPVAIVSREDRQYHQNALICKYHNIHTIDYPNNPLGEKLNAVIKYILERFKFDYLMNIDSDDIIHPKLLSIYKPFIEVLTPFFGVNRVYFLNKNTHEAMISVPNVWCAGRMIHRKLLEKLDGNLYYNEDNRGLDQRSVDKVYELTRIGYVQVETESFPYVIDIKTSQNLNDWDFIQGFAEPSDFEIIKNNYPKRITKLL